MIQDKRMQNKYERQISLDGFGVDGQNRLSKAVVALVGVGGVGCAALPLLVGAGVGRVVVFDCDTVSMHNLHRQTIYVEPEVGRNKAEFAAERFARLNSDVRLEAYNFKISDDKRSFNLLSECDICIDATDSFQSRLLISSICRGLGIRLVMASAEGYVSQRICMGNGFYLNDIISDSGASGEPAKGRPIFPPAAHLSGVLAASAAMRSIVSEESFNFGEILSFDHLTSKFHTYRLVN